MTSSKYKALQKRLTAEKEAKDKIVPIKLSQHLLQYNALTGGKNWHRSTIGFNSEDAKIRLAINLIGGIEIKKAVLLYSGTKSVMIDNVLEKLEYKVVFDFPKFNPNTKPEQFKEAMNYIAEELQKIGL